MSKAFYAILLGLVGAGIVHIVILLMIPAFSERDAWSRLAENGEPYSFVQTVRDDDTVLTIKSNDPLFESAACRFDLTNGPVRILGTGTVPFWSVSVYDRRGQNLYSFNDRIASGGVLDLLIVNPAQILELRKDPPPEIVTAVIAETEITEGVVVLRSFVPDNSWGRRVRDYMNRAKCESL
jgi:uncharacterized membrane protein